VDGEFEGEVSLDEASDHEEALRGGIARRRAPFEHGAGASGTSTSKVVDSAVVDPFMFKPS